MPDKMTKGEMQLYIKSRYKDTHVGRDPYAAENLMDYARWLEEGLAILALAQKATIERLLELVKEPHEVI